MNRFRKKLNNVDFGPISPILCKPRNFFKKELRHFKVIIKPYFQAKKQKRISSKKATLHWAERRTGGWTELNSWGPLTEPGFQSKV